MQELNSSPNITYRLNKPMGLHLTNQIFPNLIELLLCFPKRSPTLKDLTMYISQPSQLKPSFRALYNQAELMIANGKKILVEITEKKQKRSRGQNDYYWEYCTQLAKFMTDATGGYGEYLLAYTKDTMHDIHKKLFGIETTTKMTTKEFCEYMHRVHSYWSEKTRGEFQLSELPENYLERKGYIIR